MVPAVSERQFESKQQGVLLQSIMFNTFKLNIPLSEAVTALDQIEGISLKPNEGTYSLDYKVESYVYNWLSTKLCYPIELFILENEKRKKLIFELFSDLKAIPGQGRVFKTKCVDTLERLFNQVDVKFKYQISMEENSKKSDPSTNELDNINIESQIDALQMLKFEIATLIKSGNNFI
jgi:hypothetical protein